ncbi:embryonic polarity protein dorsal-like [Musca autumnalis]|uniref:embryonic polarity protein dorsal-like n=1 Tax=Musca autumnalis TaxID=221902 RepID=UPI003CEAEAD8
MEIFQQILSLDSETTATKYSEISLNQDEEDNDLDNDNYTDESTTSSSSTNQGRSSATLNETDELRRPLDNIDVDVEKETTQVQYRKSTGHRKYIEGRRSVSMDIAFPVPRFNLTSTDGGTQTSTPMEEILRSTELGNMRQLGAIDKITEWMKSNEFERTDSLTVETGDSNSLGAKSNNDDHMNTTLIEQDIDLDETPDLDFLFSRQKDLQWDSTAETDHIDDIPLPVRNFCTMTNESDDQFDDSATYSSLQIAFENPIQIPDAFNGTTSEIKCKDNLPRPLNIATTPEITVDEAQPIATPPSPPLPLPPRTPSPVPEQMLPPLPPKRKPSKELDITYNCDLVRQVCDESTITEAHAITPNISTENVSSASGCVSEISIKSPEGEATKETTNSPPSPNKRMGFISRFFTRRKSKAEPAISNNSQCTFSLNDAIRGSVRSLISLQLGINENTSTTKKCGKPVGRSSSSVSGKSPAHSEGDDIINIPLKGPRATNRASYAYGDSNNGLLDQRSLSVLQLSNIPLADGNLELVGIADQEGIKRLSEAKYNICLQPSTQISEVEHFALYTVTNTSKEHVALPPEVDEEVVSVVDNLK